MGDKLNPNTPKESGGIVSLTPDVCVYFASHS